MFIHESVNNLLQWEHIIKENGIGNKKELLQDLGFNPLFPRSFFPGKFKKRHTWGLYSEIVRQLRGLSGEILNTADYESSFFRHCFLSEINYIPSRYSEGRKLDSVRKEFLQLGFYRKFPIVIIGANGYLNREDIGEIFGATEEEAVVLGSNRLRSINASIFSSATQKIILCNQLSGAAGWTKEALMNLVAQCRTGTEKEAVNS